MQSTGSASTVLRGTMTLTAPLAHWASRKGLCHAAVRPEVNALLTSQSALGLQAVTEQCSPGCPVLHSLGPKLPPAEGWGCCLPDMQAPAI